MTIVRSVPFPDPDGVIRDLHVTVPPEPLLLLPPPEAPIEAFREVTKASKAFMIRLLTFRAMASSLRQSSLMAEQEGFMAAAVSTLGTQSVQMFAVIAVTPAQSPNATIEERTAQDRVGFAHGRHQDGLQVHVRVTMQKDHRFEPVDIAKAWVDSLDAAQRFDEVSSAGR